MGLCSSLRKTARTFRAIWNETRRSLGAADSNGSRTASAVRHDVELRAYCSTSRLALIRTGFVMLK